MSIGKFKVTIEAIDTVTKTHIKASRQFGLPPAGDVGKWKGRRANAPTPEEIAVAQSIVTEQITAMTRPVLDAYFANVALETEGEVKG